MSRKCFSSQKGDSRGASAQEAPPAAEPEPAATTGTADENGHIEVDPEAAKKALAAKVSAREDIVWGGVEPCLTVSAWQTCWRMRPLLTISRRSSDARG